MKILWLTWKDYKHPTAGGAEVVLRELSERLVQEGHEVTWLTCGYAGAAKIETMNGITVVRIGNNRYAHSVQALWYYIRNMRNTFDVVIEVVNTAPYFSVFFGKKSKRFLFYHQLAREIWFYETRPPISLFGHYFLEPIATRVLGKAGVPTVTVSQSTKKDLTKYGFNPAITHIISQGIQLQPLADISHIKKYTKPTMLSFGALRAMKRTKDQITAFELAKSLLPDLQLKIAGLANDAYGQSVMQQIAASPYKNDIEYVGKVTDEQRMNLMQKAHFITVTSVKEGWGLIVTEAASQGTPAVVYDVDGLRDSVKHNETGIITAANPTSLSQGILSLITSPDTYTRLRENAWEWSKSLNFTNAYHDFKHILEAA